MIEFLTGAAFGFFCTAGALSYAAVARQQRNPRPAPPEARQ